MPGPKTNEREGTRAVLRNTRTSAYKIREVLDLVRNKPVALAREILTFSERDAAQLVLKLLDSAIANAENNDGLQAEELFVSACFADEGRTFKTIRPRARGKAGPIKKRSAHITVIVSRLPQERLTVVKAKAEKVEADRRTRRVAASQGRAGRTTKATPAEAEALVEAAEEAQDLAESIEDAGIVDQQAEAVAEVAAAEAVDAIDSTTGDIGEETATPETPDEAGIVDQQDAAAEAVADADPATEDTDAEGDK
jgi:large subunit ribosomal protein L22